MNRKVGVDQILSNNLVMTNWRVSRRNKPACDDKLESSRRNKLLKMVLKLADNKLRNLRRNMLMKMVLRQKVKKRAFRQLEEP